MPFKDGTGPEGKGPMIGRVSGHCAETNVPENITSQGRGSGRGRGAGRGFGRGRRSWRRGRSFLAAPATFFLPKQEVKVLKSQAQSLQDSLQRIHDRLDKLNE